MASAYWREREEENRRHLIANEKEMAAHAGDIYDRMMRSAQKEIDSFYQRYAKKEGITLADAKQRISKADMDYLSKQAAKYVGAAQRDMENGSGTTGDYFSKQADDEMRLYNATMKINRLEFLKGEIGSHLVDGFDEMNRYFDGKFTEQAMEEFRRRAVILGETVPADLEVRAEKIVNGSFRNAKYSDRLWQHQDMLRMEIGRQLERGLLQGVGSREQAREIRKIFGGSQKNAERLMRTEMCRISTEVAREHYQRNGNKHFQYMALGMNPCPICEALDGKIFPVSDMEAGLNAPPMHPNCHCSTGPAYSEEEEKLYNDWLDSGAAREGVSLEEFEANRSRKQAKMSRIQERRLKDNDDVFNTFDARTGNNDIIKPKNLRKNLNSTSVGERALRTIEDNGVAVELQYGTDHTDAEGKTLLGYYDQIDKKIVVYADLTKSVQRTAEVVVHEANHIDDFGPCQLSEVRSFVQEKRHEKCGGELTRKETERIIKEVKELYPYFPWRWEQ